MIQARFKTETNRRFRHRCIISLPGAGEGNFNDGIDLVKKVEDDRLCVKKKFKRGDVRSGLADHEIYITSHLSGHANVVEYQNYYLEPSTSESAIFTTYCARGTLLRMIQNYARERHSFPESFIWHVFISLTKAIVHLQYGTARSPRRSSRS